MLIYAAVNVTMYSQLIKTQEQAVSHLFIHCCYINGEFSGEEVDAMAEKLVALGLQRELNFKEEVSIYKTYRNAVEIDGEDYLEYLLSLIMPVNDLALYSFCAELCTSDNVIDEAETRLLHLLGNLLEIKEEDQALIQKLAIQRQLVFSQKYF